MRMGLDRQTTSPADLPDGPITTRMIFMQAVIRGNAESTGFQILSFDHPTR